MAGDLDDRQRMALVRLALARTDLNASLKVSRFALANAGSPPDIDVVRASFYAAVISYARPFVSTRSIPSIPDRFNRFDDPRLKIHHSQLLEMRHNYVAHTNPEGCSVMIIPAGAMLAGWPAPERMVVVDRPGVTLESFHAIEELATFQISRVEESIQAEIERLFPNGTGNETLVLHEGVEPKEGRRFSSKP